MKKLQLFLFSLVLCSVAHASLRVVNPTVESITNPVGLDIKAPRFSWQIESTNRGAVQQAYQIQVAKSESELKKGVAGVWNSGKVESPSSLFVPFAGKELESRGLYFWRVKVWTNSGETKWSEPAQWSMAFVDNSQWSASWIGVDRFNPEGLSFKTRLSARYLRKEFALKPKIKSATIYISGLGMYECYINGQKLSNDIFAPTATDYTKRVNYNVYDVKKLLAKENNTIGVILGNGRFFSMRTDGSAEPEVTNYGFPKLLLQLEVEYTDGTRQMIVSDQSWKITTKGPIITNNEFDGEEYDARLEMPLWNTNGYNDSAWEKVQMVEAPKGKLVAQLNPNIETMAQVKAVVVREIEKGRYVVDMGQNMVGWVSARLIGKTGVPVSLKYAELTKPDGTVYMDNIRTARTTDIYTPSRDGQFEYEPRFVYHGFRFVEVTGIDYLPSVADFTGKVNYDKMDETGTFETSNATLNQIYKNAVWGIKGNYRSMPTDCPQRDERMGWLGDRAMGCFGESFALDNQLLYRKWAQDIEDAQRESGSIPDIAPAYWRGYSDNITWPSAYISVTEMLYQQFGDDSAIRLHYGSMKQWLEYMQSKYMKDYIMTKDTYGDWCMPPESQDLIHSQNPNFITNGELLSTSFHYRLLGTMARFADIAGTPADKKEFLELAQKVKTAYNAKFFNATTSSYDNGTVTANIISLMQGLVPQGHEQQVFDNLTSKIEGEFKSHVSVGLIGIQFLMRGLTEHGRSDLAYTIATNRTYPSWGYMIESGATTTWELWNGNTADPGMNSANHVMLLGDLLSWYYEDLAGIKSDRTDVGFRKVIMKPTFPQGLDYVKASHRSPYGMIRSHWTKNEGSLTWSVEIPAGSSAVITFPATSPENVTVNGAILDKKLIAENRSGAITANLPSGSYSFVVKDPKY